MATSATLPKPEPEKEKSNTIPDAFAQLLTALVENQFEFLPPSEATRETPSKGKEGLQPINIDPLLLYPTEEQLEQTELNTLFETLAAGLNREESENNLAYSEDLDYASFPQIDNIADDVMPKELQSEIEPDVKAFVQKQEHLDQLNPVGAGPSDQTDGHRTVARNGINQTEPEITHMKASLAKKEGKEINEGDLRLPTAHSDTNSTPIYTPKNESGIQPRHDQVEIPTIEVHTVDFIEEVVSKVKMVREKGATQLEIQLKPEYLGKLRLEFLYKEGKVFTHLVAKNTQVRELLLSHLPKLRETLNQQGLLQENTDIDVYVDQQGMEQETTSRENPWSKQQPFKSFASEGSGASEQIHSSTEYSVEGLNYLI